MDEFEETLGAAVTGGRVELRLEFHRSAGRKSGTIVIPGEGGTSTTLQVESPEAMNVALARLVELGFRESVPQPPAVPEARSAASVLVAGVDGYRKGWVAVSLDPSGDVQVSTHTTFEEVLRLRAQVIAVDIPIDPPGLGGRPADAAARAFVGPRASSVFATPPRAALAKPSFAEANEAARAISGAGVSQHAFALGRKILEVHAFAEDDDRVIEMHPEVSFCALARSPLAVSKRTPDGLERRRTLLAAAGIVLPGAVPGVPEADLLDAAAGAWTAARYAAGQARSFPEEHPGRLGAIWA